MLHSPTDTAFETQDADTSTIKASGLLQDAGADVYLTFLQFQEGLMKPHATSPDAREIYAELLPIAALLTQSAVALAASQVNVTTTDA